MSIDNAISQNALKSRFDSIFDTLQTKVEELNSSRLFGIWANEFPDLLQGILSAFKEDLEKNILTLPKEGQNDAFSTLNHRLDYLVSSLDSIVNNSCKNSAIHEFVSWVLRDLQVADKIPYLICIRQSLETVPIIRTSEDIFEGPLYSKTNEFLTNYKTKYSDFSIIFIPPTVLQRKTYWSLIIHEIGHVLNDHFQLVEKFNPRVAHTLKHTQPGRNYFHGREFISDYIANAYCGPVYYESLNEYLGEYETPSEDWKSTHPFRDARLFFLQVILGEKITNSQIIQTKPARDNHDLVEKLPDVMSKTNHDIFNSGAYFYKRDEEKIDVAIKQLKDLIPSITPPSILLNGILERGNEVLSSVEQKSEGESEVKIQNKIGRIIEDSIRLTNMKRTFDMLMAKV